MVQSQRSLYYKGYVAGYQDGIKDAANGKNTKIIEGDITSLPVKAMALTTQACNCLTRAGCTYVADVAELSEYAITTMRNLGSKTATEIARWLDSHGICYSTWNNYL